MGLSSWGIRAITEPKVLKTELLAAIKDCDGNRSATALKLKLPHRTFYNLLVKVGISRTTTAEAAKAKKRAQRKVKAKVRK